MYISLRGIISGSSLLAKVPVCQRIYFFHIIHTYLFGIQIEKGLVSRMKRVWYPERKGFKKIIYPWFYCCIDGTSMIMSVLKAVTVKPV